METRAYPVHEVFSTWQGEGCHAGRAAFFIRLFGCPLHCPWCDAAGTWHKDYVPKQIGRITAEELAFTAKRSGARICVITGGEPCIHNLQELTQTLSAVGLATHLETSGAFEITGTWTWITCSPKDLVVGAKPSLPENIRFANELKIIVDTKETIALWLQRLDERGFAFRDGNVWLHPEWSQRSNPEILNAISEAVKANPTVFRAGWQNHKNYKVDSLDNRSRALVPLGGDPNKGF